MKFFHENAPDGVFDELGGRLGGFGPWTDKRFIWSGETEKKGYTRTVTDWGAYSETDLLMPDIKYTKWAIDRLNQNFIKPLFFTVGFNRPHVSWYVRQQWLNRHHLDIIKDIDLAGRPGGNHLFLVNNKEKHYIDCSKVSLPYGK